MGNVCVCTVEDVKYRLLEISRSKRLCKQTPFPIDCGIKRISVSKHKNGMGDFHLLKQTV